MFSVSTQRLLEVKSSTTRKLEIDEVVQAASKAFARKFCVWRRGKKKKKLIRYVQCAAEKLIGSVICARFLVSQVLPGPQKV